jgi:hypothetical protein
MVTLVATQIGAMSAKNVDKQKDVKDMGYSMPSLKSLH